MNRRWDASAETQRRRDFAEEFLWEGSGTGWFWRPLATLVFVLAEPPISTLGSCVKETGINRSLAHASGSVNASKLRGRLVKIFRSLKRQRESDSDQSSLSLALAGNHGRNSRFLRLAWRSNWLFLPASSHLKMASGNPRQAIAPNLFRIFKTRLSLRNLCVSASLRLHFIAVAFNPCFIPDWRKKNALQTPSESGNSVCLGGGRGIPDAERHSSARSSQRLLWIQGL